MQAQFKEISLPKQFYYFILLPFLTNIVLIKTQEMTHGHTYKSKHPRLTLLTEYNITVNVTEHMKLLFMPPLRSCIHSNTLA
jgi:hypothetical protein